MVHLGGFRPFFFLRNCKKRTENLGSDGLSEIVTFIFFSLGFSEIKHRIQFFLDLFCIDKNKKIISVKKRKIPSLPLWYCV